MLVWCSLVFLGDAELSAKMIFRAWQTNNLIFFWNNNYLPWVQVHYVAPGYLKAIFNHFSGFAGVLDCKFHPKQPWLFTAGADSVIRLYCD